MHRTVTNANKLLSSIDATLKRMEKKESRVMATQQELSDAIDALVGKVQEAFTEMNKAFARLQAKIDAGAGQVDLSAEMAKVTDLSAKLAETIADAQGETTDAA